VEKTSPGSDPVSARYTIGIMKTPIEGRLAEDFSRNVDAAAAIVDRVLVEELDIEVRVFDFVGPPLVPAATTYSPFEFVRLGLTEKVERRIQFLLVVSEATFSTAEISYAFAFPSRVMNIAILSTNRLSPELLGEESSPERTSQRLAGLMLHTLGHLLNLEHHTDPTNAMYDFLSVEDLERMTTLTEGQIKHIQRTLPVEARDAVEEGSRTAFVIRQIVKNGSTILRALIRANPFYLLTHLPTMVTAALSVIIVLFFSSEMWDVASTVEFVQLAAFSLIALTAATGVLYRAFAFGTVLTRGRQLTESIIVTAVMTVLSFLSTMILLYVLFLGVIYLGTIIIFPRRLMSTWPTVDPAVRVVDHVKLSMFLAAIGMLAGSLGGRVESSEIVRHILFMDEET